MGHFPSSFMRVKPRGATSKFINKNRRPNLEPDLHVTKADSITGERPVLRGGKENAVDDDDE